jgi:dinuclear metal center YbgI/SA1388 family protein
MQLPGAVKLNAKLAKGIHPTIMAHIMLLRNLDGWLSEQLNIEEYGNIDSSLNGLQVGRSAAEVGRLALAVDSSMESFRRAAEEKADALFVHHGLFWSEVLPIRDQLYRRVRFLMDHDIALFAAHLPLDSHPELGNNARIAAQLDLKKVQPFGIYKGVPIGFKGRLDKKTSLEDITQRVCKTEPIGSLPFGPEEIETVGIISGDCPDSAREAIEENLDLFITGESSHSIYHDCLEGGLNVLYMGHYQSEMWGIEALSRLIQSDTDIETTLLDVPTGW